MSQHESIERIDKFIKQLDDHDIILEPQKLGKSWGYYQKTKGVFGYKDQYVGSFAEIFAKRLATYQQAKNSSDNWLRTLAIDEALSWINQAYAWNIVKPSDGILRRYEDALEQIKTLTREKGEIEAERQRISTELIECDTEIKSLNQQLSEIKEKTKNAVPLEEYHRVTSELLETKTELEKYQGKKK